MTKEIEFDTCRINEGIITCIMDKTYVGIAKCHEDDLDMFSEKTGCTIALYKAMIKRRKNDYLKARAKFNGALEIYKCIKTGLSPKAEEYLCRLDEKQKILHDHYEMAVLELKEFLAGKEKFYNSVRKIRKEKECNSL